MASQTSPDKASPIIILSYGFRPFFLLAGLYGALSLSIWLPTYMGVMIVPETFTPEQWHGHEMLFGFVTAAACGFLLTAVPNWTGSKPASGALLALPVTLWLAGRAVMWMADFLPPSITAVVDLALIPVLFLMVGNRILASGQLRNYIFPALLAALFAANLMFHLEALGVTEDSARPGLELAIYGYTVMLSVIAGRIIPFFTANALRSRGEEATAHPKPHLEKISLVLMIAYLAGVMADLDDTLLGILAITTTLILGLRMCYWQPLKTLGSPILWIIHLGYLWLPVGFASLAAAHLTDAISFSLGLHALSAGAFGTVALAVMTRAALGHTGRALVVSRLIVVSYLLVTLSALIRIFSQPLATIDYAVSVSVAGILWSAAFAIYTLTYWPVLTRPRVDGKPG